MDLLARGPSMFGWGKRNKAFTVLWNTNEPISGTGKSLGLNEKDLLKLGNDLVGAQGELSHRALFEKIYKQLLAVEGFTMSKFKSGVDRIQPAFVENPNGLICAVFVKTDQVFAMPYEDFVGYLAAKLLDR